MLTRLVAVDSYYRETLDATNNTDSFTFTLAERLTGVVSVALYSVEIPYSWYTFTAAKGTTSLVLRVTNAAGVRVSVPCTIPEGNYTSIALLAALTRVMNEGLATLGYATPPTVAWTLDAYSACAAVTVADLASPLILEWFDPTFQTEVLTTTRINKSLGWVLGFRRDQTLVNPTALAPSLLSVNPTKSIFMRLDDHVPGRFTNGVVSLGRIDANRATLDLTQQEATYRTGAAGRDTYTQALAPRRLTAKQLYASNAVADSSLTFSRTRDAPVDTDLFAKIPLKKPGEWGVYQPDGDLFSCSDDGPTKTITEFSGPLQLNVRDYFGPVTLSTLTVSLWDDRGNLLGLNGLDWSFTLLVKQERTQT
jgi:hypothetical protein